MSQNLGVRHPWPLFVWLAALAVCPSPAGATDLVGTVQFNGTVSFAAPIAGIDVTDIEVKPESSAEATGNGEKCKINSTSGDNADIGGNYPSLGQVSADMEISRGGPNNDPSGQCIVTLRASGTDGVSKSARGSQTVFVDATTIDTSGTNSVSNIVLRESKAISGADSLCRKFVKKQLKARQNCNYNLLKKGPIAAEKCKDYSTEEPTLTCDPGNFVDTILALQHGVTNQQLDPPNAKDIDEVAAKDQILCQKLFAKAAFAYTNKRIVLVQKQCIEQNADSDSCRDAQSNTAKPKLDVIANCAASQIVDGATGLEVPDVGSPCDVCIDGGGGISTKCVRSCFQVVLDAMSDGILGDLPECGNGIVQNGEFCDDGNTTPGDCCDSSCKVEAGSAEGPAPDPTCSDALDNDCDGDIDGADTNCQ